MRGRKLTLEEIKERANRPQPSSASPIYQIWYRARLALGLPTKAPSQAEMIRAQAQKKGRKQ